MVTLEDSLTAIRQVIDSGASSAKEIAEQTGLALNTVYQYSYRHDIKIPKKRRYTPRKENDPAGNQIKRTPERDELIQQGIEQGLMLRELGASIGLSREAA